MSARDSLIPFRFAAALRRACNRAVCAASGHAWREENSETDRCGRCRKARRGQ